MTVDHFRPQGIYYTHVPVYPQLSESNETCTDSFHSSCEYFGYVKSACTGLMLIFMIL